MKTAVREVMSHGREVNFDHRPNSITICKFVDFLKNASGICCFIPQREVVENYYTLKRSSPSDLSGKVV